MKRYIAIVLYLIIVAGVSNIAWGQATVNESLETASVYVDAVNGDDSNPGTIDAPLRTLNAAINMAVANNNLSVGTKVIVNPGVYREAVKLNPSSRETFLPITVEAATPGTAIVSGATTVTGWTPSAGNPSIFSNIWSNTWGLCSLSPNAPPAPDVVKRREMIFVNGIAMTQVMTLADVTLPGTFFIDEVANRVYLWPPSSVDVTAADVEVASLPTLLAMKNEVNWVIRGMTFQYASSCRDNGAVELYGSSHNVLFDNDTFIWNNALGLQMGGTTTNFTVQNSVASHNGQSGFQNTQTNYGLFVNDAANYNNWRGAQGGYYNWNSSGGHFYKVHNDTLNSVTFAYNQSYGAHWDTDTANLVTTGIKSNGNVLNGVFVEASEGPVSIDQAYACYNGAGSLFLTGQLGGVELRNSTGVSVTNSVMYNNTPAQFNVQGQAGGLFVQNWETGQSYTLVTSNLVLNQSVLFGQNGQYVFSDSYLGGADWISFFTTLNSDVNTWWTDTSGTAFKVPTPNPGTITDFPTWQTLTGQDLNSTFSLPGDPSQACAVPYDAPDFWLNTTAPAVTLGLDGTASVALALVPLGGMTGTATLSGDTGVTGLTASFSPATVDVSGQTTVTFTADPALAAGTYVATLFANVGDVTRTVTAMVTVPTTQLRLSTTGLTFPGVQTAGTASSPLPITVTNNSTTAVTITSITTSLNFTASSDCGTQLAAGATCTMSVVFAPARSGTLVGTLTLLDSAGTQIVTLAGTAIAAPTVTAQPSGLLFGGVTIGTSSTQSVVITNTSTTGAVATVSGISLSGTNVTEFAESDTCSVSLQPGESCLMNITFTPLEVGTLTAAALITDNSLAGQHNINLAGTGSNIPGQTAVVAAPVRVPAASSAVFAAPQRVILPVVPVVRSAKSMVGVPVHAPVSVAAPKQTGQVIAHRSTTTLGSARPYASPTGSWASRQRWARLHGSHGARTWHKARKGHHGNGYHTRHSHRHWAQKTTPRRIHKHAHGQAVRRWHP